ncbi:MAG TPA: acyloxyacyl hydrolase [Acidobacteriaceae bacterium]|nr:acyloxyacyl hydrolase [Acidobacteriaceae bacterium]
MSRFARGALLCLAVSCAIPVVAQDTPHPQSPDTYSRKNTFTLFAEYSPTSSHILLGDARQRILVDLGGAYTRRVVSFWGSDVGYRVELRPVQFESDPLSITKSIISVTEPPPIGSYTSTITSSAAPIGKCQPASGTIVYPPPPGATSSETISYTTTCGRQWTFGQVFTPIGFKYSMRTRHPLQPYVMGTLGYMYTSRPVPVADAESFNFVFDFGAGLELYRSGQKKRSLSIEARYHHFSNRNTAPSNPGTDNLTYILSYNFGH